MGCLLDVLPDAVSKLGRKIRNKKSGKMTTNFRNKLPKTKPKTSSINNTKSTRAIMFIFFKCSPGLCPRVARVVKCFSVHTLFQKGGYANSPTLPTLPTLPYKLFFLNGS